jgi:hypothetical protein
MCFLSASKKMNTSRVFAHATISHEKIFDDLTRDLVRQYRFRHCGKGITRTGLIRLRGCLNWLLSALYDGYFGGADRVILPLGKSSFEGKKYGEKLTRTALELLVVGGWANLHVSAKGLHQHQASEILITDKLRKIFEQVGFVFTKRRTSTTSEVIVLREKDDFLNFKHQLPLPDIPEIDQMRANVRSINRMLLKHAIFPYLPDNILRGLPSKNGKNSLNLNKVQYRRVFVCGRLDRCGRFSGPWWQYIPKNYRRHIRIDGEPVVELDFRATFITILYGKRGLILDGDPYLVFPFDPEDPQKREIIKNFTNAALSDKRGTYTPGRDALRVLGVTREELSRLVGERHPQVKDALSSGEEGLGLMFIESQIAEGVMLRMARMRIPVLCLHDGFLCQTRSVETLYEIMQDEFKRHTGLVPKIKQVDPDMTVIPGTYEIYENFMRSVNIDLRGTVEHTKVKR